MQTCFKIIGRGVISPVLFCLYIDDVLLRLSSAGVSYYLALNNVGALAYADDIVLLAPTPSAMRKLLQICDAYAAEFDISFNPDKYYKYKLKDSSAYYEWRIARIYSYLKASIGSNRAAFQAG